MKRNTILVLILFASLTFNAINLLPYSKKEPSKIKTVLSNHVDSVKVNDTMAITYKFKNKVLVEIKSTISYLNKPKSAFGSDNQILKFNSTTGLLLNLESNIKGYNIQSDGFRGLFYEYFMQRLELDSIGNLILFRLTKDDKIFSDKANCWITVGNNSNK